MDRALFVPCFSGELGWELINYIPYVNYIVHSGDYSEVHVAMRIGREFLYPMATHTYPILLPSHTSMGNSGPQPPKTSTLKKLRKRFKVADSVPSLKGGMRYAKRRRFFVYESDPKLSAKWSEIESRSVICSVRGRNFGTHKNWSGKNWRKLCRHLLKKGFVPVVSGIKELVDFEIPDGCIDVRDKTTMGDLVAIMQKSSFVIGPSSGPMHLASLSRVPHAVWGHPRLHERYTKTWNPHKTTVEYYSCRNQFEMSVDEARQLVDRISNKVEKQ